MFEVTNLQYELFDPGHRKFRGRNGFSNVDDEAVTFVNWYDAPNDLMDEIPLRGVRSWP